jgi:hypothetical protein
MITMRLQLFGGACDGYWKPIDTFDQPKLLYQMWPGHVDTVKRIADKDARLEKQQSLETLAYRYVATQHSAIDGVLEMRYQRFPKRDLEAPADQLSL